MGPGVELGRTSGVDVGSGVRVGTGVGLGKTGGVGVSITALPVAGGRVGSGPGERTTQDATPKSSVAKMLKM